MNPTTRFLMLIIVLCAAPYVLLAQKKVTVHGQIVELSSYVQEGIVPSSPNKRDIAMRSLSNGGSLAIVENKTSKLYLLVSAVSDTSFLQQTGQYLGVPAFVKGTLKTRGGVRLVVVEDIGKSLGK
jgi:hypothetical protein